MGASRHGGWMFPFLQASPGPSGWFTGKSHVHTRRPGPSLLHPRPSAPTRRRPTSPRHPMSQGPCALPTSPRLPGPFSFPTDMPHPFFTPNIALRAPPLTPPQSPITVNNKPLCCVHLPCARCGHNLQGRVLCPAGGGTHGAVRGTEKAHHVGGGRVGRVLSACGGPQVSRLSAAVLDSVVSPQTQVHPEPYVEKVSL